MSARLRLLLPVAIVTVSAVALAGEMQYFGAGINYWGRSAGGDTSSRLAVSTPEKAPGSTSFDWAPYLDLSRDEFFREGDYLPPRPFMELAREPSDENIKKWLLLTEAKNAVAARLEARLKEYLAPLGTAKESARGVARADLPKADLAHYQLRFYFEATCPHCQKMAHEVFALREAGMATEALQVDDAPLPPGFPLTDVVAKAPKGDLAHYKIDAVPFLLIAEQGTGKVYRLSGYHPAAEVVALLPSKR